MAAMPVDDLGTASGDVSRGWLGRTKAILFDDWGRDDRDMLLAPIGTNVSRYAPDGLGGFQRFIPQGCTAVVRGTKSR